MKTDKSNEVVSDSKHIQDKTITKTELLEKIKNDSNVFILNERSLTLQIKVKLTFFEPQHTLLLTKILNYLLVHKDLKVYIIPDIFSTIEINAAALTDRDQQLKIIFSGGGRIFHFPNAFEALLSALIDNHLIDTTSWLNHLKSTIKNAPYHVIDNIEKSVEIFVRKTNNLEILKVLLPELITNPNMLNNLKLLSRHLNTRYSDTVTVLNILKTTNGASYSFLHEAFSCNKEAFDMLRQFLPELSCYDLVGNSFLHICNSREGLNDALQLTPDINHQNSYGNTALHSAALALDFVKIEFLLKQKASPIITNNESKTFITLLAPKITLNERLFDTALNLLMSFSLDLELPMWFDTIHDNIRKQLKKVESGPIPIVQFNTLFQLSKNETQLEKIFPDLFLLTMRSGSNKSIKSLLANDIYQKTLMKMNGKPHYFLQEAIQLNNSSFEQLVKILPLDYEDKEGRTPLHHAAKAADIDKARVLLSNGADPEQKDNKGKSFWTVAPERPDSFPSSMPFCVRQRSLLHYQTYHQHGHALKVPPLIPIQFGLNCGFYAVAIVANFFRSLYPKSFRQAYLPARKKDTIPKATQSLRQLRKALQIPSIGPIFKAQEIARLLQKCECQSLICDIENYAQFIEVIQKAMQLNLPIIIPFSATLEGQLPQSNNPTSQTAHWATIIAWTINGSQTDCVLLSQDSGYTDTSGPELFKAFFDIEPEFKQSYAYKKKGEWQVSPIPEPPCPDIRAEIIPLTKLDDFRRKLIVAIPPDFPVEQLDFNVNRSHLFLAP